MDLNEDSSIGHGQGPLFWGVVTFKYSISSILFADATDILVCWKWCSWHFNMSKALNKTLTTCLDFFRHLSFHHQSLSFTVFTPPLRQASSTSYHLQYLNLSQGYSFLPFLSIAYPNINQGHFTKYLSIDSPWPPPPWPPGEGIFEVAMRMDVYDVVKHHVVFGSIVVPGVVFVEMALEATKELFGHGVRITDVCLGEPLEVLGARGMMEIYGFYRDFIGI